MDVKMKVFVKMICIELASAIEGVNEFLNGV
jgi:hypothetical protein